MMDQKTLIRGWVQAFFSVLVLWGVNNVFIGYSAQILHANYLIYTCSSFVSCAFFLLLIGGKGPLVKETLRSIDTWAFGFIMLIGYILTLSLFSYVSSTEGSLLQRISLLFSIICSWLFLSRRPAKGQLIGVFFVLVGIVFICKDLPEENKGIIYLLMFLEGLALTGRMFVAEIHRPHRQAMAMDKDPKAKARVVGFVMFIISTFFLLMTFLLALLQTSMPLPVSGDILPTLSSFRHPESIFAGLIAGVFLLVPLRMIEFSSANIIKTENFLAIAALSCAATYFWEWLLQPLTGMNLSTIGRSDVIALIIITFGSLIAAVSKIKKKSEKEEEWRDDITFSAQDPEMVSDTREIVANTLEHFEGDIAKTAHTLSVHKKAIEMILADTDKVCSFPVEKLREAARHYRHKVALSDALTGLVNRSGFMSALKQAPHVSDEFSVLFIDLDKFKPVNDTYGHDAGDFVLRGVAERLRMLFPKNAEITRLGGDEFCLLLLDCNRPKAEEKTTFIKDALTTPFIFEDQEIVIGASVGISVYPEDGSNPEALLKCADGSMYDKKKER